jgi:homoserine dehydrogenase
MQELSLVFVGFGTVARGCAHHLLRHRDFLAREHGFPVRVVAIADLTAGSIEDQSGIDLAKALEYVGAGRKLNELQPGKAARAAAEILSDVRADIVAESTWTNLKDAQPGLSHIRLALENGMDVVTSNKGPMALAFRELKALAASNGRFLRFESTVMSGTPVFSLFEPALAGSPITGLRGILNGTTNYILTEMASGRSYEQALRFAQEAGYAEADPSGDVEACDSAAKGVILANALMGGNLRYADVERIGITGLTREDLSAAAAQSKRLKLIVSVRRNSDGFVCASVRPTLVDAGDPLAHVDGVTNALQISTEAQPDITIIGPGAGGESAGYGLLSDMIAIHRQRGSSPALKSAASSTCH